MGLQRPRHYNTQGAVLRFASAGMAVRTFDY